MLTRHPPHIPVPSIMIGFKDTIVGMSYSFVILTTFFIMISGPIAITSSYFTPALIWSSNTVVTKPLVPRLPSSVAIYTLSQNSSNNSLRITNSALLPPMITSTGTPIFANLRSCGYNGAAPTPPATPMTRSHLCKGAG